MSIRSSLLALLLLILAGCKEQDKIQTTRSEEGIVFASMADEGLDPSDYSVDRLRQALASGGNSLDAVATGAFLRLAHDFDRNRSQPVAGTTVVVGD